MFLRVLGAGMLILTVGCKSEGKLDPKVENLGRAVGPVETRQPIVMTEEQSAPSSETGEQNVISGQVLETIDASRYTYIRLHVEGKEEIWAAVPQIKLEVGHTVEVLQSLVMKDFESKTLGRVFPSVVFGVLKGQSQEGSGPMMGGMGMGAGMGGMGGN